MHAQLGMQTRLASVRISLSISAPLHARSEAEIFSGVSSEYSHCVDPSAAYIRINYSPAIYVHEEI